MDSDPNTTATVSRATTKLDVKPTSVMASFNSRSPNSLTSEILKPDLIVPGVTIIVACKGSVCPTPYPYDTRNISYNIVLGTSMSCPLVSGLALLLKGAHPEWNPAVIRSALMTTAYTTDNSGKPIIDKETGDPATSLDYGSGYVDPMDALNPGLVYNATEDDYLGFLCALNYSSSLIRIVTKRTFTCDPSKEYSLGEFNYPSFSVVLGPWSNTTTYKRTLTNVGEPSTYQVSVVLKNENYVNVTVEPSTLTFSKVNQENSYTVTFVKTQPFKSGTTIFASLQWSNGNHTVRSPIVVTQK